MRLEFVQNLFVAPGVVKILPKKGCPDKILGFYDDALATMMNNLADPNFAFALQWQIGNNIWGVDQTLVDILNCQQHNIRK